MSVAHLDPPAPSTDLADAAGRGERVFLFCLGCRRSLEASARAALAVFGAIPFGMLMGKKACRRCHETLWIVLPWYAPTPRDWVKVHKPASIIPADYVDPVQRHFHYQVETIVGGDVMEATTLTKRLPVADFAFEDEVRNFKRPIDRFWLRNGTRLIRDSARDLKVVP